MTTLWLLPLGVGAAGAVVLGVVARQLRGEAVRLEEAADELSGIRRRMRSR